MCEPNSARIPAPPTDKLLLHQPSWHRVKWQQFGLIVDFICMEIGRLQQIPCAYHGSALVKDSRATNCQSGRAQITRITSNKDDRLGLSWTSYRSLLKLSSLSYSLLLIWLIWLEIGSLNDDTMIQHGSNYFCRSIVNPNQKAAGEHWAVRVSCRAAEQFKTEVARNGGRLCQPYDKARVVQSPLCDPGGCQSRVSLFNPFHQERETVTQYIICHMYTVIHIQI